MNTYYTNSLPAPVIPAAEFDGLIKLSDLQTDLPVEITVPPDATAFDRYQLTLGYISVGESVRLGDSSLNEDSVLTLNIPLSSLDKDDNYSVGYELTLQPGGGSYRSDVSVIKIDRTAPGGALVAPVILPDQTSGDIKGKIPGYVGMEIGDTLQTLCNGVDGPKYVTTIEDLSSKPIEITFPQVFLDSLQSKKVKIVYHITDRAGNKSTPAFPAELTLQR
ncbi:MAG TPA: hypothetical protein VF682_02975 [Pseudomonas sp.]|jgi:hypothetical protein